MFSSNATQVSSANYIEDVFSTYLWTGTGSNQTLTTNVDTSTYGGLFWTKNRTNAYDHALWPTALSLSGNYLLKSNTTGAATYGTYNTGDYVSNSTTGVTVYGNSSQNYVTWTFRKQAKFFDVVTYTGNGTGGTQISHSLGSTPGCIIVKSTSTSAVWTIFHQSLSQGLTGSRLLFDTSAATNGLAGANIQAADATTVTLGSVGTNNSGTSYVMYLFAHNAGGFGLTGTDNVISCSSFTTDGSGNATVDLGYEPQWLLVKANASGNDWYMYDNMRGLSYSNYVYLSPNLSAAEGNIAADYLVPTATGFKTKSFAGSTTYIYIAIRRGPMKVPTSGTSVFSPQVQTPTGSTGYVMAGSSGFPIDWLPTKQKDTVVDWYQTSRLTNNYMSPNTTAAEGAYTYGFDLMQGVSAQWSTNSTVSYAFRRAPSFFDEVCYTGTGSATTQAHNLGAVPELMILKPRSNGSNGWCVYSAAVGNTGRLLLDTSDAAITGYSVFWNSTTPTSSVFSLGTAALTNESATTFVAYLFATCAGVSKVGSYTGTGTTKQVDCGFTGGARFVLIKRTDSTGDWYVWDTARGIVSGNDPYLLLNSTAAETTGTDYIDPYSAGFEISSTAPAAINASGGTFIFLAIA